MKKVSLTRIFFLAVFCVLVLHGIFGKNQSQSYVPQSNSEPIISLTVDATDTDGVDDDTVYTFGNANAFPGNSARACALISADSGKALYLKNADAVLPMASTTKIMTALVAMELLSPDEVVTVPGEAVGIEGSSIYLAPGEKLTVRDLLYGLLLESGNDAAVALAVYACGNVGDFVTCMNRKASEMGLVYTHFENPHGLSSDNHHTTAHELAIITYHAMKNPLFRTIVGTKSYTVTDESGIQQKYFSNHNRLLHSYSGATGVKTGYTILSGRCLVTSAERDGTEFIVVTLDDRTDFADHARLFDYAFDSYRTVHIADAGTLYFTFGGKKFSVNDRVCVTVENGNSAPIEVTAILTPEAFPS